MKRLKKILYWILISLLALLIGLAVFIYINKADIIDRMKEELNKSSQVKVDFSDPSLTFISSFPNIGISVKDLVISNIIDVADKDVLKADIAEIIIDIASVINKSEPDKIVKFSIHKPVIDLHIYKNGKSNFDFPQSDESIVISDNKDPFKLDINELNIKEGIVVYTDHTTGFYSRLNQIDLLADGEVSDDVVVFDTKLSALIYKVNYGRMPIAEQTNVDFDGVIKSDMSNMKFELQKAILSMNDMAIVSQGSLHLTKMDIIVNGSFKSKDDSFKKLLSLVPSLYAKDFQQLNARGKADFDVVIDGVYNDHSFPRIIIKNSIHDGSIQYEGVATAINDIGLNMVVDVKNIDDYTVDIDNFSFKNKEEYFTGKLKYRDTKGVQDIDLEAKGDIDLAVLKESIMIDAVEQLSGKVSTDMKLKGALSDMINKDYDKIDFSGFLKTDHLNIKAVDYPLISFSNTTLNFDPRHIDIPNFVVKSNQEIIKGSISINNPLALMTSNSEIDIKADVYAAQLDVDKWLPSEHTAEVKNKNESISSSRVEPLLFDFDIKAKVDKLIYNGEVYSNNVLYAKGDQDHIEIDNARMSLERNSITVNGIVSEYMGYLENTHPLKAKLNITSPYLNLNDFMTTESNNETAANTSTSLSTPDIPTSIDMIIHGDIGKILYDDIILDKLEGNIIIHDKVMKFDQLSCFAFDGKMDFDGYYDTKTGDRPKFSMKYNNSKLSFSKTFAHVDVMKKFMPIMKYIDGLLSTNLTFSGVLDDHLNIDPNSVIADGYFETIDATMKDFGLTTKMSNVLGLEELSTMKIMDSRNWFTIKEGVVEIKEFDQHIKGIDLKISGNHNITQAIDYLVKAHIPREMLSKNSISNTVNTGIDLIQSEASKLGINIKSGSHIDLDIKITGTLTDPKFKVIPRGSSGESVKDVILESVKDEVKKRAEFVKDSIRRAGDKLLHVAKDSIRRRTMEIQDSIRRKAEIEKEKAIKKAKIAIQKKIDEEIAKKVTDSLEQVIKNKAKDVIPEKTQEEIDKLKDKLEDWNPFKKKK